MFIMPMITFSAQLNSGSTGLTYECVDANGIVGNCDFSDLVAATKKVLNWAVGFALFFSVIVIAYAGFLYMQGGAIPGKRTEANKTLTKAAIGIAWVIAAWLVVNLITNTLMGRPLDAIFST